jgi:hypothetical protein
VLRRLVLSQNVLAVALVRESQAVKGGVMGIADSRACTVALVRAAAPCASVALATLAADFDFFEMRVDQAAVCARTLWFWHAFLLNFKEKCLIIIVL